MLAWGSAARGGVKKFKLCGAICSVEQRRELLNKSPRNMLGCGAMFVECGGLIKQNPSVIILSRLARTTYPHHIQHHCNELPVLIAHGAPNQEIRAAFPLGGGDQNRLLNKANHSWYKCGLCAAIALWAHCVHCV